MESILFLAKVSLIFYIGLVFIEDIILIVPDEVGPTTKAIQQRANFIDVGEWLFFTIFNILLLFIVYWKFNSVLNLILLLPLIGLFHLMISLVSMNLATLVFRVKTAIRGY